MKRRHYRRDGKAMRAAPPTWILTRFASECFGCAHPVRTGERVLYDPSIRKVYSSTCPNGCAATKLQRYEEDAARRDAAEADELANATIHAM